MAENFFPAKFEFPIPIRMSEQRAREENFLIDCLRASMKFTHSNLPFNLCDGINGLCLPATGMLDQKNSLAAQQLLTSLKDNPLILLVMRRPRHIGLRPDAVISTEPGQIFPLLYDYRETKFPQVSLTNIKPIRSPIAADRQAIIRATDLLKTRGWPWQDSYTLAFSGRPDGRLNVHRVYNLLGFNTETSRRPLGLLPLIIEKMMEYHNLFLYAGIKLPRVNS